AIEVVRMPESMTPATPRARGFSPSVIEGSLGRMRTVASGEPANDPVVVPVMGRIAAGTPIEAIQTHSHSIMVPPDMLSTGEHFALEVRGDSMIEEGILDGDWVVIEHRDQARNGEIVVALVDGEEATLKRLEAKSGEVVLHPANSSLAAMHYSPERVQVQGVLVGQMRRYH
ncbi:MAG: transcriptional repressor LexA, partial [Chromatiales bacterium]|nr:transcriptional repressor LexA [Chromatiales bacterium]